MIYVVSLLLVFVISISEPMTHDKPYVKEVAAELTDQLISIGIDSPDSIRQGRIDTERRDARASLLKYARPFLTYSTDLVGNVMIWEIDPLSWSGTQMVWPWPAVVDSAKTDRPELYPIEINEGGVICLYTGPDAEPRYKDSSTSSSSRDSRDDGSYAHNSYSTFNLRPLEQMERLNSFNESCTRASELRVYITAKRAALKEATDSQLLTDIGSLYLEIGRLQQELDQLVAEQQRLRNLLLNFTLVERLDRARRLVLQWGYNVLENNETSLLVPRLDAWGDHIRPRPRNRDRVDMNSPLPIPQPSVPLRVWFVQPMTRIDLGQSPRTSYYGFFPGRGQPIPNPPDSPVQGVRP